MFQTVKIREGHDNFFTPLRLIFASLVVIGHAFAIAMRDPTLEPQILHHYTFSYLAVNMFFIASGFLVTKSMLYRGDAAGFTSARALRIFPALIVHVLFVMLIIGPMSTNLPLREFFSSPDWYLQPLKVLTFYETAMFMPGTFASNAEQMGSAPLWTLRYEVLAYIGTLAIFMLGLMRKKWMVLAQFILPAIAYLVFYATGWVDYLPATGINLLRFGIAYGLGATIYAYRKRLSFNWLVLPLLLGLTALTAKTPLVEITMNIFIAYFVMWAAYVKIPRLNWTQKLSDTSYGIYIYHWAVMQMLFQWMPNLSVLALFAIGFPITVILAWLSWTFVEKPMLSKKTWLANKWRSKRARPIYDPKAVLLD
ncbi:acyltransferase family protein [Litorimonas sp. RW-G-Af-16]|uniref:acyltransferase family protein n=1 Tax=Litorimonas sp. RW-G-Af-16 TaxID=3241168 RepID=UPI00390C4533